VAGSLLVRALKVVVDDTVREATGEVAQQLIAGVRWLETTTAREDHFDRRTDHTSVDRLDVGKASIQIADAPPIEAEIRTQDMHRAVGITDVSAIRPEAVRLFGERVQIVEPDLDLVVERVVEVPVVHECEAMRVVARRIRSIDLNAVLDSDHVPLLFLVLQRERDPPRFTRTVGTTEQVRLELARVVPTGLAVAIVERPDLPLEVEPLGAELRRQRDERLGDTELGVDFGPRRVGEIEPLDRNVPRGDLVAVPEVELGPVTRVVQGVLIGEVVVVRNDGVMDRTVALPHRGIQLLPYADPHGCSEVPVELELPVSARLRTTTACGDTPPLRRFVDRVGLLRHASR